MKNICIYTLSLLLLSHTIAPKYNPLTVKQAKGAASLPARPHSDKFVKNMNEQELKDTLVYAKATHSQELVFKIFHFLMTVSTDQDALKEYKLDFADYCFKLQNYEKAAIAYEEFFILYPGSAEVEYSQYKSILCWFYLSLAPEKDQSYTLKSIMLVDDFLRKFTGKKYKAEVKKIKSDCRQKLFEHEAHVFENYIKQSKFIGAQKRLDYIIENFSDIKQIDQYITYLEKMLKIAKDPKRPFMIPFNLKDATPKEAIVTPEKKKKSALFFLS